MKSIYIDKKYIYLREDQKCYYCFKTLKLGQVTLDHYFPRSLGGTEDYPNLVASCKRCNTFKKSRIPSDVAQVHLKLFFKAVKDGKIISIVHGLKQEDFRACAQGVIKVELAGKELVARGDHFSMHIRDNQVYKIEGKCP